MFFLIRVAFWLSLVLVLLPTGKTETTAAGPGPMEALSAAGAAMSDMRGFCERQPAACEVGAKAASAFGEKAQASAKMLYEYLTEQKADDTFATGGVKGVTTVAGKPSQDTLTASDRAPAWRGQVRSDLQGRRPS